MARSDAPKRRPSKLLTANEVAEIFKVKPVTIYAWVKQRKLPHVVLSAGPRKECIRFRPEAIERFVKERERQAKGWTEWDRQ